MHKLGWRASDTRELSFHSCAVPEGNLLGERGRGFKQFLDILDGGRVSVAAMGVGLAQGAYDLAIAYAKERQQFGQPIASFQAIQFQLADMATEIEAGRQLVYRAAWLKDEGKPFALAAAQAKLYTGLLSNRVVNAALQIHGGYGFMEEFAISRLYRDQKILEIGEGTNEVQRMVIAQHLGCRAREARKLSGRPVTPLGHVPIVRHNRACPVIAAAVARFSSPRRSCGCVAAAAPIAQAGIASRCFAAGLGVSCLRAPRAARPDRRRQAPRRAHGPARADRRPRPGADGDGVRGPLLVFLLPAPCSRRSRGARGSAPCSGRCSAARRLLALGGEPRDLARAVPLRPALATRACTTSSTSAGAICGILVWTLLVDPGSHSG
jgi:hypothetical protein